MSTITLFRQARIDGGSHTGIDVDGRGWEYYDSGSDEHDPALVWYVDLRVKGDHLPDSPEGARDWLLENDSLVSATYQQLAERLEVGIDPDVWPLQVENIQSPAGVSLAAVCSCMRRVPARQMSKTVQEIGLHWKEYLERLPQVQHQ